MLSAPGVVVHGIDHARAALRLGLPVVLLSGEGAALYAGCGWWQALMAMAAAAFPETPMQHVLDCAAAPGFAMAALRQGQRLLVLSRRCPGFAAVRSAAATRGATILPDRPPALDLAEPGAFRRLDAWLRGDTAPAVR
jgi:hypothetical protein